MGSQDSGKIGITIWITTPALRINSKKIHNTPKFTPPLFTPFDLSGNSGEGILWRLSMIRKTISGGMPAFIVTWFGQVVSLVGSGLTSFALGIWVYQRTDSPTLFALIGLFAVLPKVIFSPIAGVLADRWDRRKVMIIADLGAGLSTLFVTLMLFLGRLDLWHIYLSAAATSLFGAFQWPAYTAVISQLIPGKHLGRANGMIQFGRAAAEIFAPLLAGILLLTIQLKGVILIDVATFIFAMLTLTLVRFPRPEKQNPADGFVSFKSDLTFGWRYILSRKGLLNLLYFGVIVNFIWGMVGALLVPMILLFTTSDKLGMIITIAGAGLLTGSLLMTVWGGPKRRIKGVIFFEMLSGICFIFMGLRPGFWWVALSAFGAHVTIPIIFGSNQALWQTKIEPDNQGRVFAAQQMFASAAAPLAYLLAGPLAERIFEPLMASGAALSQKLGPILEYGAGRGIGLMFILMGLIKIVVSILGYLNPRVRLVEDEIPDALPGITVNK
jgi:DHA3 family macrolide efflux protein-like MFS transporter